MITFGSINYRTNEALNNVADSIAFASDSDSGDMQDDSGGLTSDDPLVNLNASYWSIVNDETGFTKFPCSDETMSGTHSLDSSHIVNILAPAMGLNTERTGAITTEGDLLLDLHHGAFSENAAPLLISAINGKGSYDANVCTHVYLYTYILCNTSHVPYLCVHMYIDVCAL